MRIKQVIQTNNSLIAKHRVWIGLVLVLLLGNVFMTIQTAATGAELAQLESTSQKLLQANRVISDELVTESSLTAVEKRAHELGFAKPSNLLYLRPVEPVAQLP